MSETLSSVCEVIVDCVNRTAPESVDGEFLLVGTPAMRGNKIDETQARRVSESTFKLWTRRLEPRAGDLLLAREAPVGPVVMIPGGGRFGAGQRTTHLRPNPAKVDGRFLYYLLTAPATQERLIGRAMGSTVAHLRVADLKSFALPILPTIANQQAIAEVLGALDDKIAVNTTLAASSASLARASLQGAVRASGAQFRVSEISLLVSRGITPSYVNDGVGVRVLNQKCIRDQRVSLESARWTDPSKARREKMLVKYDVLVNSTGQGTLGRVARWTGTEGVTVDSHITIVRPDPTKGDPVVIGQAMLAAQREIEGLGEGSTGQTELSRVELGRMQIHLPSVGSASALGMTLQTLTTVEDAMLAENRTLAATRDALLPQLLSGRLRVRDAEAAASVAGA